MCIFFYDFWPWVFSLSFPHYVEFVAAIPGRFAPFTLVHMVEVLFARQYKSQPSLRVVETGKVILKIFLNLVCILRLSLPYC